MSDPRHVEVHNRGPTVLLFAVGEIPPEAEAVGRGVYSLGEASDAGPAHNDSYRRLGFSGRLGETAILAGSEGPLEVHVGLGPQASAGAESLRRAGAAFARAISSCRVGLFDLRGLASEMTIEEIAAALGEGAALASYRFDEFKSTPKARHLEQIGLVGEDEEALFRGIHRATVVAEAVGLARDLANLPAGALTPTRFGEIAREIGRREHLATEILGEAEILEAGLGGLAGVAQGSLQPPRLVRLTYEPDGATEGDDLPTVVLVGKGITFDSGGLSLKSPGGMVAMKTDMSGAAAVLATLGAARSLKIAVRVVGLMPLTENLPGPGAIKPGDVLRIRNGKTIEVLNTDAEGRLVLADGLSLAVELSPDSIVDLATLTGACVTALGSAIAGVLGNDDRLVTQVREASARAGEPTWPLPLPTGYRSHIDSEVADMKNTGAPNEAGAISAALLLEEFVGSSPWVHLDIAGPSRSGEDRGYLRKGATGFGVRTLLEFLKSYTPLGGLAAGSDGGAVYT